MAAAADWLVIFLVSFPVEPLPQLGPDHPMYQSLVRLDATADLADERDSWSPSFAVEVRWTRSALRELADAPPSADAHRWPCKEHCRDMLALNEAHAAWLGIVKQSLTVQTARIETAALRRPWCAAQSVSAGTTRSQQRRALAGLREALGPEAYHAGQLLPPVPMWRFRAID